MTKATYDSMMEYFNLGNDPFLEDFKTSRNDNATFEKALQEANYDSVKRRSKRFSKS